MTSGPVGMSPSVILSIEIILNYILKTRFLFGFLFLPKYCLCLPLLLAAAAALAATAPGARAAVAAAVAAAVEEVLWHYLLEITKTRVRGNPLMQGLHCIKTKIEWQRGKHQLQQQQ